MFDKLEDLLIRFEEIMGELKSLMSQPIRNASVP